MYKFYVPTYYMFYTRLKKWSDRAQWFLTDIVPVFVVCWFLAGATLTLPQLTALYVLAMLATYVIYEMGYVGNDVFTIRKENKPPARLTWDEVDFFQQHYIGIIAARILWFVAACAGIYALAAWWGLTLYLMPFLLAMVLLRLIFLAHNSVRGRPTILTFFGLATFKYSSVFLLFVPPAAAIAPFVLGTLLFPLVRTLGNSTREKYKLPFMPGFVGDFYHFRVKYYALWSVLSLIVYGLFQSSFALLALGLFAYYLALRLSTIVALRKAWYKRKTGLKRYDEQHMLVGQERHISPTVKDNVL